MINIWAAEWHSTNKLAEYRPLFLYEKDLPALFRTRRECRAYIKDKYGYLAERREEPHGWRMPQAVKVRFVYDSSGRY